MYNRSLPPFPLLPRPSAPPSPPSPGALSHTLHYTSDVHPPILRKFELFQPQPQTPEVVALLHVVVAHSDIAARVLLVVFAVLPSAAALVLVAGAGPKHGLVAVQVLAGVLPSAGALVAVPEPKHQPAVVPYGLLGVD